MAKNLPCLTIFKLQTTFFIIVMLALKRQSFKWNPFYVINRSNCIYLLFLLKYLLIFVYSLKWSFMNLSQTNGAVYFWILSSYPTASIFRFDGSGPGTENFNIFKYLSIGIPSRGPEILGTKIQPYFEKKTILISF